MKIPVILINKNILTWTRNMIECIKTFENVGDIIIVDNVSTYEPLLEWYKTNPCEIIYSDYDRGQSVPWQLEIPQKRNYKYYIVSDPDLDLSETPKDNLMYLVDKLEKHQEYDRIGLSLSNYDVSEKSPYYHHLKRWKEQTWSKEDISDGLLIKQEFDTTYGIYKKWQTSGPSCCTDIPYSAKHIPWEITYDEINNLIRDNYEFYYYLKNANPASSYKKFINFNKIFNDNDIFIYYHIFLIGNWLDIVKEQISVLKKSNLFQKAKIKVGAVWNERDLSQNTILKDFFKQYKNVDIAFLKINGGWGEAETLKVLKNDCDELKENAHVLYIHCKGVTQYKTEKEKPVADWRKMMEYFLIENWEKCIEKLNAGYDCCGINYQIHSGYINGERTAVNIFNGNFFWVSSNYVKKLNEKILFEHRYSAETWVCSIDHKAYSFYNSPIRINLYYESNEEYKNIKL